jgi:hypothetical protein
MSTKLSPAKREAAQRRNILRKLERILKNYDKPSVTDACLRAAIGEAIEFIKGAAARNTAKAGGLGRK